MLYNRHETCVFLCIHTAVREFIFSEAAANIYRKGVGTLRNKGKVWVIPPTQKERDSSDISRDYDSGSLKRLAYESAQSPDQSGRQSGSQSEPRSGREKQHISRGKDNPSTLLALLPYFLGPMSVLASKKGRRSRFWMSIAVFSGLILAMFVAGAAGWIKPGENPSWVVLTLLVLGLIGIPASFAAWSRGLTLVSRRKRSVIKSLPSFIRRPWVNCLIGIILPGFGLYSLGRRQRAAAAVWSVAAVVLSATVLLNGDWLWSWQKGFGYGQSPDRVIEYMLISAAVTGLLGAVFWISQALDGARLAGASKAGSRRNNGDLAVVALIVSIVAFGFTFQKEQVARSLDEQASVMLKDGYRVIPLCMASAAARIDPSRTEYSIRIMEIYQVMGRSEAAASIRREILDRLTPCSRFIHDSGLARITPDGEGGKRNNRKPEKVPEKSEVILTGPDIDQYLRLPPSI